MKKVFLALTLFLLGVSTAACAGQTFAKGSWRYKMTVTVETPEGLKSGSAVREVSAEVRQPIMGEQRYNHFSLSKGAAVVVDLGARGVLFAPMIGITGDADQPKNIVFKTFPYDCDTIADRGCAVRYYASLKETPPKEVSLQNYPMLVYFENLKDPKTIQSVLDVELQNGNLDEPIVTGNYFEKYFGEGVRLKSISIEITQEDITGTVKKYLPPYGQDTSFKEWFRSLPYGDRRALTKSAFIFGE